MQFQVYDLANAELPKEDFSLTSAAPKKTKLKANAHANTATAMSYLCFFSTLIYSISAIAVMTMRTGTTSDWVLALFEVFFHIAYGVFVFLTLTDNETINKWWIAAYWYISAVAYVMVAYSLIMLLAVLEVAAGTRESSDLCFQTYCAGDTDFAFLGIKLFFGATAFISMVQYSVSKEAADA